MKYCPKCGAKLSATDKFCDRCGSDVSRIPAAKVNNFNNVNNAQPAPVQRPIVNKQASVNKSQSKLEKNRKIRNNCLIIVACLLFLTAAGVIFFTLQSNNSQKADQASFAQTAKDLGFEKAERLSAKDTAGLSVSYAHMHFKDDPNWEKAFDDAQNGDLHIKSYPEYQFSSYDVKAPKGGRVYVIDHDTGYVVSDLRHPSRSRITYISKKQKSQSVFLPTLAKHVKKNSNKKEVQHLVSEINLNGDSDDDDTSDSNDDSDDEDVSWDDDKEEQLADFMDSFGKKMKQDYEEYDGEHSIKNIAGEKYPEEFEGRTFKLYDADDDDADDAEEIDIGWDPDLKEDYDYHCVAIFNCDVGSPEQHITYLFCIYNDKPVVLVDQTTNGDDCMVKETSNKDVRNAFANILAGKDVDSDDDDDDSDD